MMSNAKYIDRITSILILFIGLITALFLSIWLTDWFYINSIISIVWGLLALRDIIWMPFLLSKKIVSTHSFPLIIFPGCIFLALSILFLLRIWWIKSVWFIVIQCAALVAYFIFRYLFLERKIYKKEE
jgi:hypothetical protein